LGYVDPKGALRKHVQKRDIKQMQKIKHDKIIKGHPQTLYINESGMYSLILLSKMPKAKKFNDWVTREVLPSIRKYGTYKLKKNHEEQIDFLMNKLNYIQNENELMKKDLKKEKYPNGGLIYAIDYSTDEKEIYRIGMTGNMNLRKKIYDTHSLYKKDLVVKIEHNCPIKLEYCIRGMLYDYRYKNKKDFYICNLKEIKKAFKTCSDSINCMEQTGGNYYKEEKKIISKNISTIKQKIIYLNKKIN
jgi:prophage antirepressor-like protein